MLDYTDLLDGPAVRETVAPLPEPPTAVDGPVAVAVRTLRGQHMTTRAELFDEFAAALQFPPHFGHNLDAFDECLRDLSCPEGPDAPVVLALTEPEAVLAEATAERPWLLEAVADANAVRSGRDAGRIVLLAVEDDAEHAGPRWWRQGTGGRP